MVAEFADDSHVVFYENDRLVARAQFFHNAGDTLPFQETRLQMVRQRKASRHRLRARVRFQEVFVGHRTGFPRVRSAFPKAQPVSTFPPPAPDGTGCVSQKMRLKYPAW